MGKLREEITEEERIRAAREKWERHAREKGLPRFRPELLAGRTWKTDEPAEEIDEFIRSTRQENSEKQ